MTETDDLFAEFRREDRGKLRRRLAQLRAFIFGRRAAYVRTFQNPAAQPVLEDLARFCRAAESTFDTDPRVSAVLEGRREVWLRIQQHLRLSPEEVFQLATGQPSDKHNI